MCSYHKLLATKWVYDLKVGRFSILIHVICNHVVAGMDTKTVGIPVVENKNKNEGKMETTLE